MNKYDNEGKWSEFNTAALKMKRLDRELSIINELNGNLLAFNPEVQVYNYQLKLARCENLFQEVESKLNEDEKEDIYKLRKALLDFVDKFPIYKNKKEQIYPFKEKKILDETAWKILRNFMANYETKLRMLLDNHGMDTAYGEDDDGL